ncbi:polysaccharide biosynthesis/export family protein [Flocculibacter collagenilyticus]|uniref:polysaccharide biosynthesis/export family protein n=1 Tax=Flocculibacter collagenilyticus TaxID=2744479 RepID=UPI0018F59A48|nr:polysaccharide biosynthesis/export family protein [Flocculibacter collagenilyticus]
MLRQLFGYILFCIFSAQTLASLNIQPNASAETKESIQDSSVNKFYGSWLFNGGFKQASFAAVNPNYKIAQGDKLLVQVWGGFKYQSEVVVDPQGNIIIPEVGPIKLQGVTNTELNKVFLKSINRVYKKNVESYITLLSTQKVKVFLSGLVKQPGLYEGQSGDSILRFIDQAGGVRTDIGSLRQIAVKRHNKTIQAIDLYDFIQKGEMPYLQLQDGDVIFVGVRQGTVAIEGEVGFEGSYEVKQSNTLLKPILQSVAPKQSATHVTIISSSDIADSKEINVKQFSINELDGVTVAPDSLIKVTSQMRQSQLSIELIGEHHSSTELVMPVGSRLIDVINQVEFTPLSNRQAIQLFRPSVAVRQKEMLNSSLNALEQSVLTARSETNEAAQLRKNEAETILMWIEKARKVETKGQVLLTDNADLSSIYLQQGDRIVIPAKRNLVMVHGEVLFPTAVAYQNNMDASEFINHAGEASGDIDDMNILLMKQNGALININEQLNNEMLIEAGDEIFVLAKPDEKSFQLTKDISQVIYQIAASAAVILAL